MKTQLRKRVESFIWRGSMAGLAFIVTWTLDNLAVLELSPVLTMLLALVLGEISKYLNSKSV